MHISIDKNTKKFSDNIIYQNMKLDNGLWLNISLEDTHMQKEYKELLSILSIIILIILILTSLIILWRIKTLVRPLKCLTQLCHDVQTQANQIQLCQPNTYEVKELYDAILLLLQKNYVLYDGVKDLSLSLWYYHYSDIANIIYTEAAYTLHTPSDIDINLGLQYDAASQTGASLLQIQDSRTFGTSIELVSEPIGLHILMAYNKDTSSTGQVA